MAKPVKAYAVRGLDAGVVVEFIPTDGQYAAFALSVRDALVIAQNLVAAANATGRPPMTWTLTRYQVDLGEKTKLGAGYNPRTGRIGLSVEPPGGPACDLSMTEDDARQTIEMLAQALATLGAERKRTRQ